MNHFILLFSLVSFCYCAPVEEIIKAEVAPVTGGWNALPLNSRKVIGIVKLLQNFYNKQSLSLCWTKFSKVEEASVQVTNKVNYRFTIVTEPTGCLKEADLETCQPPDFEYIKGPCSASSGHDTDASDILDEVEKCHYFLTEQPRKLKLAVIAKTCEKMGSSMN